MTFNTGSRSCRLSISSLVAAVVLGTLANNIVTGPASAATSVVHSTSVFRHGIRSALRTAHTGGTQVYNQGELYGGSNTIALCFTCEASNITGTAPPSESLDRGSGVNSLTGDYSYNLNLFNAHGFGLPIADALTYDAQLAQAQIAGSLSPGPLGYGWNSTLSLSATPGVSSTEVVNEGSGAQDTFYESPSGGTSTSCPAGDQTTTNRYTVQGVSSLHQWCALANVQAQFADINGTALDFQQYGGQESYGFNWNGSFSWNETGQIGGVSEYYNIAPNYEVTPSPEPLQCPSSAQYCDVFYFNSGDDREILEAFNSNSQITEIEGPEGPAFMLSYDSHGNLASVTGHTGVGPTGMNVWNFVYDTSAPTPDSSDLVQIYDPDSGVGSSPPVSAGAAHSNYIAYNNTGTDIGMVSEVEDGTGAVTSYSYADGCSTGNCVLAGNPQATTVTYPAQVPCPSCTAVSPIETDSYTSGVETQSKLGAVAGGANSETWQYAWSLGYGGANSTETVTYPDSLSGSSPTATIVLDPAGNVISTTNAVGDVATSAYNDVGVNVLPELLWSYPGSSSNGPSNPPSGSEVYTYDSLGYVQTRTDPLGNVTKLGYYSGGDVLCYVEPPTVAAGTGSPSTCPATGGRFSSPGTTPPVGSTAYSYDNYGNMAAVNVDFGDTATGADPQTTTSSYDLMGDALWSIPPAGQSGVQNSSNPYAKVANYYSNGLVAYVTNPGQGTTTYTYDSNFNPVEVQTPFSSVYQMAVFDADNRPCYQVTSTLQTGLTCSTGAQAGSTTTTYVTGSNALATVTDGNVHTTSYYYGDLAFPNSPTEIVDAASSAIKYTAYDDFGYVCESGSVSIAIGTSTQCNIVSGDTTTSFNSLGNETSITDPSGNTTTTAYINTAFPTLKTSVTNPLSSITSYAYNADGELTSITNPDTTLVTTAYDGDGRVCVQADNGSTYSCGGGTGVAGVTSYGYNGANDRISMTTYTPSTLSTSYSYSTGQLTSTTDSNSKTTAYLYNHAGQIQCETYPISTSATCGTLSSPATGSTTNTIVTHGYDASGRLSTVKDWLGNTTTYAYTKVSAPLAVTSINYPSSSGLVSTMTQDNDGSLATLTAGSSISDTWSYDNNQRVSTVGINGSTSAATVYNANNQITGATNLAHTTGNDTYTLAANGEIAQDAIPSGATTSYSYNAVAELCSATAGTSATSCGSNPANGSSYSYTTNGQRSSATPYAYGIAGAATHYSWNPYGELCNAASSATSCGAALTIGTSYTYNGDGLRMTSSTVGVRSSAGAISATGTLAQAEGTGISTLAVMPVNIGDAFVLAAKVKDPTVTISSVVGGGATWHKLTNAGSNPDVELWLGTISSTGSSTITVTYTGSVSTDAIELDAQEYTNGTGGSTSWSQDFAGSSNNTNSSATVAFPTLTPRSSHELYVGFARTPNTGGAGSTSGFTYDVTSPNTNIYIYDPNVSSSVSPTATESPAGTSIAVGALITARGGAPFTGSISATGSLAQAEGTGISTLSVSPANVGDAFVLAAKVKDASVTISSISGGGATWRKLTNAGANPDVELWLGTITATGASTITVTYSGSVGFDTIELDAQEYTNGTGTTTNWSQDVVGNSNNTTSSTTVTFPTLTPSATNELYVGFARTPNTGGAGSTSGFTYDVTSPNTNIYIYDPNVSSSVSPTATESPAGTSIAVGALITASALTVSDSTWDYISGASIPLNINDATTSGATTTNTSYIYGDLLYGGTAPIEQLVTSGSGTTASFLVASPQGVQGVYSLSGAVQELAMYSPYGNQSITSGTVVTPFGFQGSYTDSTGLIYLISRYFDPVTGQFMSIDPDLARTDQPYAFVNDAPLNASDPMGRFALALSGSGPTPRNYEGNGPIPVSITRSAKPIPISLGEFGYWEFSASITVTGPPGTSASLGLDFNADTGLMTATATVDGVSESFYYGGSSIGITNSAGFHVETDGAGSITVSWPISISGSSGTFVNGTVSVTFSQMESSDGFSYDEVELVQASVASVGVLSLCALGRMPVSQLNSQPGGYSNAPGRLPGAIA